MLGWQTADRLFGTNVDPIDKIIQIEGVHFRVVGVSEKKGTMLGQSQDSFAHHSARASSRCCSDRAGRSS